MAINFKLNPRWSIDPETDDMGRGWVGWDPKRSDNTNLTQNRGLWYLGARAQKERYATFSLGGTVRLVAEIDQIETIPPKERKRPAKKALIATLLEAGHPAYDYFIDRPVDGNRNPVSYIADPDAPPQTCACGCGEP